MIKLLIIAGILTALLGSGWKAYALIDEAAYDRAELDFRSSMDDIRDKAAKDAVRDWRASQAIAGESTDVEIRIVEKIRVVEREIPKIIERIVEIKPECTDLPALGLVFSQQAEISNNRENGRPEDTG